MNLLFVAAGTVIKECGYRSCFVSRIEQIDELCDGDSVLAVAVFELYMDNVGMVEKAIAELKKTEHVKFVRMYPHRERRRGTFRQAVAVAKDNVRMFRLVREKNLGMVEAAGHSALCRCILVGLLTRVPVLFNCRGVHFEEQYAGSGRGVLRLLRWFERCLLRWSSGVIVVSEAMRAHVASLAQVRSSIVIPNCYDEERFGYSDAVRNEMRSSLQLESRIVIVYAGELFREWHRAEDIMKVFCGIKERLPQSYLMILTSDDTHRAREMCREFGLSSNDMAIRQVAHAEVSRYLCAGDLAILLRKESLINRVACPTKAAEYLACGLPIMISAGIGDISSLIERSGTGFVLQDYDDKLELERAIGWLAGADLYALKSRCVELARRNLSWQCYDKALFRYFLAQRGQAHPVALAYLDK